MDNYVTIKEAVEITGLNQSTVYRKCNSKKFKKYVKLISGKKCISNKGILLLENGDNSNGTNSSSHLNSHEKENDNKRENVPQDITLGMAIQGWSRADSKLLELQEKYFNLIEENKKLSVENNKLRMLENTDNKVKEDNDFSDNFCDKIKRKSFWTRIFRN